MSKQPIWIHALHIAIFLDLFGFGMLIPDIQLRAEALGAPGWLIGAILASTFILQIPLSPKWGQLSDRIGRKPVLLACTAFSAGGMLVYGAAATIPLLFASRIFSGLGGANVAIAQAIAADQSDKSTRTAAMGRMGAAVSLGLVGGPVIGGLIAHRFGSSAVGFTAGISSAVGGLLILLLVPYVKPTQRAVKSKKTFFDLGLLKDVPQVRSLAIVASIAWFSLAALEGTFGRLIKITMGYDQAQFGIIFGYESLLGFVIQAVALGWVAKKIDDAPLLRMAYLMQGLGLGLTPFAYLFPVHAAWLGVLLVISTIYAVGSSLANPTINSLCSKLTPDERQGELFGLLQGTRSIGFIVGPILGGALFDLWFAWPYLLAAGACVLAASLVKGAKEPVRG